MVTSRLKGVFALEVVETTVNGETTSEYKGEYMPEEIIFRYNDIITKFEHYPNKCLAFVIKDTVRNSRIVVQSIIDELKDTDTEAQNKINISLDINIDLSKIEFNTDIEQILRIDEENYIYRMFTNGCTHTNTYLKNVEMKNVLGKLGLKGVRV